VVSAQPAEPSQGAAGDSNLEELGLADMSLEELLNVDVNVSTATRQHETSLENAPAIMTVITREEIERFGYRSVPEALATVPGLFIVDDLVTSNLAIRGIWAGPDSWSRTFKFMVDGVPVQYHNDGGGLLGPEFVPIESVESIEIMRGPGSALYGANALLGVVNVITTKPEPGLHARLGTSGGTVHGNLSASNGAAVSYKSRHERPFSLLLAAHGEYADRSGLSVPASSPAAADYEGQVSQHDISRPLSLLGKLGWHGSEFGELKLETIYQRTDANQAFAQTAVLDPNSRIARSNSVTRLDYTLPLFRDLELGPWRQSLSVHGWGGYTLGQSLDDELLMIGGDAVHRERLNKTREGGAEFAYTLDRHSALLGVDVSRTDDEGDRLYDVDLGTGERTARNDPDGLSITNIGIFAQAIAYPLKPWGIMGGMRYDNNSEWGDNVTFRAATVVEIFDWLHAKAMAGSSFVPPSPAQLTAVPIGFPGGVQGNPDLASQTARTFEFGVIAQPIKRLKVDLALFKTDIADRVEYQAAGQNLRAENVTDSSSFGGELNGEFRFEDFALQADVAYQKTALEDPDLADYRWQLAYNDESGKNPPNFPQILSHQKASVDLGPVELAVAGTYVGARKSSVLNIVANGESYELDPYYVVDLRVRTLALRLVPKKTTEVSLHARNLLDTKYEHGGTLGVDIPAVGRSVMLGLRQEL
jgi:iron complex outermembrane receptor protein